MRLIAAILILCSLASGADPIVVQTHGPATVTIESAAVETGRPLPVLGCWNTGENQLSDGQDTGYTPDWQLEQIDSGVPWLPTFELFWDFRADIRTQRAVYFEPLWSECKARKLPLVFVGQNFADLFRTRLFDGADLSQPHPFVIRADGTVLKVASPYAPKHHFYDLGRFFGEHLAAAFAADYPDPPSVLLMDNAEVGLASPWQARTDTRCPAIITNAYATMTPQEAQQVERYEYSKRCVALAGEFKRGLREALPDGWQGIKWVAYSDFGNEFCRVSFLPDSLRYSVPWADAEGGGMFQMYDGVTANIGYFHSWSTHRPTVVRSIQTEAGNARYAIDVFHRSVRPDYLVETHYWNGRNYPADQYLGCVRCTLWQTQTEHHRVFIESAKTRATTYPLHVDPLMTATREVHEHETLRRFWKHGRLLNNRWLRDFTENPQRHQYDTVTAYGHPYPHMMPPDYNDPGDRLFLQHVPLNDRLQLQFTDTAYPRMVDRWVADRSHQTPVRVFAVALELDGEYLVYAHAPGGAEAAVEIQVCPDGHAPRFAMTVDVPVAGAFWMRGVDSSIQEIE